MKLLEQSKTTKTAAIIDIPLLLTRQTLDALMEELKAAEEDLSVGSVVLVFPGLEDGNAAGLDWQQVFPELSGIPSEAAATQRLSEWNRRVEYLRNLYVPVVAAVDGSCSGWMLECVLAADILICSTQSSFTVRSCPNGIPYQLAWMCGVQRLKRFVMFEEEIDGAAAVEWGFGNRVVQGSSIPTACEIGKLLALPPRDGMSVLKESLNAIEEHRAGPATQWTLGLGPV